MSFKGAGYFFLPSPEPSPAELALFSIVHHPSGKTSRTPRLKVLLTPRYIALK